MHTRRGVLLVLLLLTAVPIQAATLYVAQNGSDGGPCSQAAPCRTINGGIARLSGGDTLVIGNGIYNEVISDSGGPPGYTPVPVPGGSAGAPTTLKAQTPGGVTLRAQRGGGEMKSLVALETSRSHHIRLEGLVTDAENGARGMRACWGTHESQHIQFVDMECKNAELGWAGNGEHITFTRVWVHHIGGGRNGGTACEAGSEPWPGLCHAFYSQPGGSRSGPIVVEDSLLEDINGYAIHDYVNNMTVRNTRMANNFMGGIFSDGSITATNNIITESGVYGILAAHGTSTLVGNTITPVVGINTPQTGHQIGTAIEASSTSTVANNSVDNLPPGTGPRPSPGAPLPPSTPALPQAPQIPPEALPPSRPPTPTLPPRTPSTVRPPSTTPIPLATTSTPAPPAPEAPGQRSPMGITTDVIDSITTAFLAALRAGGTNLGVYSLAILSLCATIAFYKEYALVIMYGTGLGDALAGLLVYVMGAMGYYWLMVNLFPMAEAALTTAIQWGLAGTGGTPLTAEMITKPSFIMQEGLKAAYPVAEQASWFERVWSSVKMINNPGEMVGYWFVVLAFLAITAHHMMMLIEYHLSVMCAAVLIPWGLWSATASVGEFAVGWLTGGFIRALVSTTMLGIALPLFGVLNKPAEGFITLYHTAMLIGGAFIFAVLAWVIPARAAGIASRGMALAVHGGTVTAAAMTFARFGMMVQGAGAVATRAHSRMMAAREMTRAA